MLLIILNNYLKQLQNLQQQAHIQNKTYILINLRLKYDLKSLHLTSILKEYIFILLLYQKQN